MWEDCIHIQSYNKVRPKTFSDHYGGYMVSRPTNAASQKGHGHVGCHCLGLGRGGGGFGPHAGTYFVKVCGFGVYGGVGAEVLGGVMVLGPLLWDPYGKVEAARRYRLAATGGLCRACYRVLVVS